MRTLLGSTPEPVFCAWKSSMSSASQPVPAKCATVPQTSTRSKRRLGSGLLPCGRAAEPVERRAPARRAGGARPAVAGAEREHAERRDVRPWPAARTLAPSGASGGASGGTPHGSGGAPGGASGGTLGSGGASGGTPGSGGVRGGTPHGCGGASGGVRGGTPRNLERASHRVDQRHRGAVAARGDEQLGGRRAEARAKSTASSREREASTRRARAARARHAARHGLAPATRLEVDDDSDVHVACREP